MRAMVEIPVAVRGFLASVGVDPPVLVKFQYNPTDIADKRSVNYASLAAPGTLLPVRQYTGGGERTITFTVVVDGIFAAGPEHPAIARDADGGIGPELAKYRAFVYPRTARWPSTAHRPDGFTGIYAGADENTFAAPPGCRFGFGDRVVDCLVTEIAITELVHAPNLAVLRARVVVSLVELTPYGAGTGPGGR
jgi:hypothetical protein